MAGPTAGCPFIHLISLTAQHLLEKLEDDMKQTTHWLTVKCTFGQAITEDEALRRVRAQYTTKHGYPVVEENGDPAEIAFVEFKVKD